MVRIGELEKAATPVRNKEVAKIGEAARTEEVRFIIISDSEIANAPPLSSIKMRRMGVQIETLTVEQVFKLNYFMHHYIVDKVRGNRSKVQG